MWGVVRECTNIKMLLFYNWMNAFRKYDAFIYFQNSKIPVTQWFPPSGTNSIAVNAYSSSPSNYHNLLGRSVDLFNGLLGKYDKFTEVNWSWETQFAQVTNELAVNGPNLFYIMLIASCNRQIALLAIDNFKNSVLMYNTGLLYKSTAE